MHLRSSSLTARSAGGPLAATRVSGNLIETGAGFPDGYNYKTIYYNKLCIHYTAILGLRNSFIYRELQANPNIFAQRIPTFSRKESANPNIFAQESQHFRATFRIPTFSRKNDSEKHKITCFLYMEGAFFDKRIEAIFIKSPHFRAGFLPNPHIFAQCNMLIY